MLTSLSIRNYALIDELAVDFTGGLVILTGETGAGKSILIDALGLILGERASPDVVRAGSAKAVVEAFFDITGNDQAARLLQENQLDPALQLILRREVLPNGHSRCFVNDTPVSLSLLKQAGDILVDLHGQHEHQSLLRSQTHLEVLDAYASLGALVSEYRAAFRGLGEHIEELDDLLQRQRDVGERRDLYEFQLQEIDSVSPQPGEEERILAEVKVLENSEHILSAVHELSEILLDGERSVSDLLSVIHDRVQRLKEIDERFREAVVESESARAIVSEMARFFKGYATGVMFSPERLEEVRDRLGRLSMLKRKYGDSVERVLAHREKVAGELAQAESFDDKRESLKAAVAEAKNHCARIARRLSMKRVEAARAVESEVVDELGLLGIPSATFSVRISQKERGRDEGAEADSGRYVVPGKKNFRLTENGFDEVEFFISTNVGEEPRPLARTASGGEISRIMLALKNILARQDRLPVVVFDEIDVGVSGRIARAVGQSLKKLSACHQVIAITHLPQIASLAGTHYLVYKTEEGSRTRTSIRQLTAEERVREVARLLSGTKVTQTALLGARELIGSTTCIDER